MKIFNKVLISILFLCATSYGAITNLSTSARGTNLYNQMLGKASNFISLSNIIIGGSVNAPAATNIAYAVVTNSVHISNILLNASNANIYATNVSNYAFLNITNLYTNNTGTSNYASLMLQTNGSVPMSGDLNMNYNNITNIRFATISNLNIPFYGIGNGNFYIYPTANNILRFKSGGSSTTALDFYGANATPRFSRLSFADDEVRFFPGENTTVGLSVNSNYMITINSNLTVNGTAYINDLEVISTNYTSLNIYPTNDGNTFASINFVKTNVPQWQLEYRSGDLYLNNNVNDKIPFHADGTGIDLNYGQDDYNYIFGGLSKNYWLYYDGGEDYVDFNTRVNFLSNIDAGSFVITNLAVPTSSNHSARLHEVQQATNNYTNIKINTAYFMKVLTNSPNPPTTAIDWSITQRQHILLTNNTTFTFTAPPGPSTLILVAKQDGTGGRTITWPAGVLWSGGGTEPTATTAINVPDVYSFYWDGTTYFGMAGLNFK